MPDVTESQTPSQRNKPDKGPDETGLLVRGDVGLEHEDCSEDASSFDGSLPIVDEAEQAHEACHSDVQRNATPEPDSLIARPGRRRLSGGEALAPVDGIFEALVAEPLQVDPGVRFADDSAPGGTDGGPEGNDSDA